MIITSLEKAAKKILLLLGYEDIDVYWGHDTSFPKKDTDEEVKKWSKDYINDFEVYMNSSKMQWYDDWGGESAKKAYDMAVRKAVKYMEEEQNEL